MSSSERSAFSQGIAVLDVKRSRSDAPYTSTHVQMRKPGYAQLAPGFAKSTETYIGSAKFGTEATETAILVAASPIRAGNIRKT